ncbi:MAG: hypothetical protein H0W88_10745, partial [Parachlamydiaceae bacterium]|nr:hypothetical protein [Parachlamydiaceae bacterium]
MKLLLNLLLILSLNFCQLQADDVYVAKNAFPDGFITLYDSLTNTTSLFKKLPSFVINKIAVNPTGTLLYVLGNKSIRIYDTGTSQLKKEIITNLASRSIVFNPGGTKAYVNMEGPDQQGNPQKKIVLGILDTSSNVIENYIDVYQNFTGANAGGITITQGGQSVYLIYGSFIDNLTNLVKFNTTNNTIIFDNKLDGAGNEIVALPDNKTLYIVLSRVESPESFIAVFNAENDIRENNINLNFYTTQIAANPNPNIPIVYLPYSDIDDNGHIALVDTRTKAINSFTHIDVNSPAVNPSGDRLYTFTSVFSITPNTVIIDNLTANPNAITPSTPPSFNVIRTDFSTIVNISIAEKGGKVGVLPPRHLKNKIIKNRFLTQTDIVNHLTWKASLDPSARSYFVYRDDEFIISIPSTSILEFNDHNRKPGKEYIYSLIAVNE